MGRSIQKKRHLFVGHILLGLIAFIGVSCKENREFPARLDVEENPPWTEDDESRLINETFRIDILQIDAVLTYRPEESVVDGEAQITFNMRPGQRRPLFHFDAETRYRAIHTLELDGRRWEDPTEAYSMVTFPGSTQKALELKDEVDPAVQHQLKVTYRLNLPAGYPRFSSNVNDIRGIGNEEVFPTINSPNELARHRITFRVDGDSAYRMIGSGRVEKREAGEVQEWTLDSERDVASYTLMFALLPSEDTVYDETIISGVPVRVMAFSGDASIAEGIRQLETWIPQLIGDLGVFPMPRGLSIFLLSQGGGMEYYGGTITSLWALRHEVFHMYAGCSTVARTYRDSWWDEAVDSWYTTDSTFEPIEEEYRSNIVGGRSPVAVGFDRRAYVEGAQIMEYLARRTGGRAALIGFLRHLYETQTFSPFNSLEFAGFLKDYSGFDVTTRFREWLFSNPHSSAVMAEEEQSWRKTPDWRVPRHIQAKYDSADGGRGLMFRRCP